MRGRRGERPLSERADASMTPSAVRWSLGVAGGPDVASVSWLGARRLGAGPVYTETTGGHPGDGATKFPSSSNAVSSGSATTRRSSRSRAAATSGGDA